MTTITRTFKLTLRRSTRCLSLTYPGFYFGLRQLSRGETPALISYDNTCGLRSLNANLWPIRIEIIW